MWARCVDCATTGVPGVGVGAGVWGGGGRDRARSKLHRPSNIWGWAAPLHKRGSTPRIAAFILGCATPHIRSRKHLRWSSATRKKSPAQRPLSASKRGTARTRRLATWRGSSRSQSRGGARGRRWPPSSSTSQLSAWSTWRRSGRKRPRWKRTGLSSRYCWLWKRSRRRSLWPSLCARSSR